MPHYLMLVFGWGSLIVFVVVGVVMMLWHIPPYYFDLVIEVWILFGTGVVVVEDTSTILHLDAAAVMLRCGRSKFLSLILILTIIIFMYDTQ
jgi:hypothetical protein